MERVTDMTPKNLTLSVIVREFINTYEIGTHMRALTVCILNYFILHASKKNQFCIINNDKGQQTII